MNPVDRAGWNGFTVGMAVASTTLLVVRDGGPLAISAAALALAAVALAAVDVAVLVVLLILRRS